MPQSVLHRIISRGGNNDRNTNEMTQHREFKSTAEIKQSKTFEQENKKLNQTQHIAAS